MCQVMCYCNNRYVNTTQRTLHSMAQSNTNEWGATALGRRAGVSRNTIYQRAKANGIKIGDKLTNEQLAQLGVTNTESAQKDTQSSAQTHDSSELETLKQLNAQLASQNEHLLSEITVKNTQIEKHQTALEHEQALHLSAIRQLEQAKDELKALESGEQEQEPQPEKATKKRHWWQF